MQNFGLRNEGRPVCNQMKASEVGHALECLMHTTILFRKPESKKECGLNCSAL